MSKLVTTVNWFSACRNRKAVHPTMHCTLYKSSLRTAWRQRVLFDDAMHNAKDHPLWKHCKQFSAYDKRFDWLEIVSRYNWPKVQIFAYSSLSQWWPLLWSGNPCKYMPMCAIMEIWPDFIGFSGISLVEASLFFHDKVMQIVIFL